MGIKKLILYRLWHSYFFIVSHRNLWRKPFRSLLIIFSIIFGIGLGLFVVAIINGLNIQRVQNRLAISIAHLKITHPEWDEDKPVHFFIKDKQRIQKILKQFPSIWAITTRLNFFGLIHSSKRQVSVDIYGVNAESEKKVFDLSQFIVSGTYLTQHPTQTIMIGESLSEKLNVGLNDSIRLTFLGLKNEPLFVNCKIGGIYRIHNKQFEATHVFTHQTLLQKVLKTTDIHQILCKTSTKEEAIPISQELKYQLSDFAVYSWLDVAPDLAFADQLMRYFFQILLGVILFSLSISLVNMLLMTIWERKEELWMLQSIGMSPLQIKKMLFLETTFLMCYGIMGGALLNEGLIFWTAQKGISMTDWTASIGFFTFDSSIKPQLNWQEYRNLIGMVVLVLLCTVGYATRRLSCKK